MRGSIESLTLNDMVMEIAVKENFKEEFKDFMVDLALVKSVFPETELKRNDDMEDYLLEKLSIEVELLVQGSSVQNLQLIVPTGDMEFSLEV